MDQYAAIEAKTKCLQKMMIRGRRALSALPGLEEETLDPKVLIQLAGELNAQEALLYECRRLDESLPANRDQWAAWLATQPPELRRPAEEAVAGLAEMATEAARIEAEVGRGLGRLRDEVLDKLKRIRAGHRIIKAYRQPRPNVPRLLDRKG